VAVAIHAPIGLRTIARETLGWRGKPLEAASAALAVALAALGWRAVAGLFA
jgi:fumarate reductase subunit C